MNDLQDEQPPARSTLVLSDVRPEVLVPQFLRPVFVCALFLRQVVEQLANVRIFGSRGRAFVEAACLDLDGAGLLAHGVKTERPHEPHGSALHETLHVLPANERNVFSESSAIRFDEPSSMAGFLGAHAVEHCGGGRKVLPQSLGKISVDPLVFFLQRDREREDLLLREAVEVLHARHRIAMPSARRTNRSCAAIQPHRPDDCGKIVIGMRDRLPRMLGGSHLCRGGGGWHRHGELHRLLHDQREVLEHQPLRKERRIHVALNVVELRSLTGRENGRLGERLEKTFAPQPAALPQCEGLGERLHPESQQRIDTQLGHRARS